MADKPSVLFVCVHNAGRSQMAAAFLSHLSGGAVEVRSAGSAPADQVNPAAVAAMAEVGIDITGEQPKLITEHDVRAADLVVTLGREARVESVPGTWVEDWDTDEPSERGIDGMERMRLVRDDIDARVQDLLTRLLRTR